MTTATTVPAIADAPESEEAAHPAVSPKKTRRTRLAFIALAVVVLILIAAVLITFSLRETRKKPMTPR